MCARQARRNGEAGGTVSEKAEDVIAKSSWD